MMKRRGFLRALLLAGCAPAFAQQRPPHVVVVGGGFGGMTVLRALQGRARLTLIEPHPFYFGGPASNLVVAGFRPLATIRHARDNIGWETIRARAVRVDGRNVMTEDGGALSCDRVVAAPGVELNFNAMPGYAAADAEVAPHAWRGGGDGAQTALLQKQIEAMPDGGVLAILPPEDFYSCPPAPYERASLAAARFVREKPRAKILVIDPKEKFAKQALFAPLWRALYGGMIEWRGGEAGGIVEGLDLRGGKRGGRKIVETEFGAEMADVLNYIPPQRAGELARASGLVDESGWCPVDAGTFESAQVAGVHVVGDAAKVRTPKSADAARSHGRRAARGIVQSMEIAAESENTRDGALTSACYSLAGPAHGLASEARYRVVAGENGRQLERLEERLTPPDAPPARFRRDAEKADQWHAAIAAELFAGVPPGE